MKPLVVYYSHTGSTAEIASHILERARGVERRLIDEKPRANLVASFKARAGLKTKLRSADYTLSDYDLVIILSPVWGGSPTPAVNTFLAGVDLGGKKVIAGLVGARESNTEALGHIRNHVISRNAKYVETVYLKGLPVDRGVRRPTSDELKAEAAKVVRLVEGILDV